MNTIIAIIKAQEFNFQSRDPVQYGGHVRGLGFVSVFSSLWETEGDYNVLVLFLTRTASYY